jgi:hypothetical protein
METPAAAHCVRCGGSLAAGDAGRAARGFAAAPHEHRLAPRIVSTIFPHLPRARLETFRALLGLGTLVIACLALAGLYPVALIASAVLVPLLTILYFREVDLYEDEPLRVLALTAAWGGAAGVGVGFLADAVRNGNATLASQTTGHAVLWNGVLLPSIGFLLVLAGPLVLLPYRKFDDVLDGVTFGGACAVVFAGAELLTHSSTFLSAGLDPPGLVTPWAVRLLTLGIAVPVLAAAAVGSATGALWLRYRAPRRDRSRLGPLGRPALAVPVAAAMLVGSAVLQLYLNRWAALAAVAALGVAALVWLRLLVHVGLAEEAAEVDVGPRSTCANCGAETPRHTFCANCGIALRALPKQGPAVLSRDWRRPAAAFALGLAALVGLATVVMAAVRPGPVHAPCPGSGACANPPRLPVAAHGSGASSRLKTWTSTLGIRLGFDPLRWHVDAKSGRRIQLTHADELMLLVETFPAGGTTSGELLSAQLASMRDRYPDLELDPDPSHQPPSVTVGSVAGVGAAYAGHDVDGNPVEVLIDAASADDVAVVLDVWTSRQPRTSAYGRATAFDVLVYSDQVLESLRWPFDRVAKAVRRR